MALVFSDPNNDSEWLKLSDEFIDSADVLFTNTKTIHSTYLACYSIECMLKALRFKNGLGKLNKHDINLLMADLLEIPRTVFVGESVYIFEFGKQVDESFVNDFTLVRYQFDAAAFGTFSHGEFLRDIKKVLRAMKLRLESRRRRRR